MRCSPASGLWLGVFGLVAGLVGCDAFEYYGPIPNLRKVIRVEPDKIGKMELLALRGKSLTAEAAHEIRLLNTVRDVVFEDCEFASGRILMESLSQLGRLDSLSIRRCNLQDEDLSSLAGASNLQHLEFIATEIDGSGLSALAQLPIISLTLNSKMATAQSLRGLTEFENLEELVLSVPGLDVSELPMLSEMKKLRTLTIINARFSAEPEELEPEFEFALFPAREVLPAPVVQPPQVNSLESLASLPNLKKLSLSSDSVNDETLRAVAQIQTLEVFHLSRNRITDEGVRALESLPHLKSLSIWAAEGLTKDVIPSVLKHRELESICLTGALISYVEARELDALPNLKEREVGLSRWEIAERTGERYVAAGSNPDELGGPRQGRRGRFRMRDQL